MQTVKLKKFESCSEAPLTPGIKAVPSMMSEQERRFLLGYAKEQYTGDGVIVDAGIFLGGSTHCFATGVKESRRYDEIVKKWSPPIRSYDHGIVSRGMTKFFQRHNIEGDWKEGDSFEPLLRKFLEPHKDVVDLSIGDLTKSEWTGEPIEILFLDVLKSPELQLHALKSFYKHLIPGKSLLIQQDYFYDGLPFIKVTQEALSPYFTYVGEIRSMALFTLKKEIPADVLTRDPGGILLLKEKISLINKTKDKTTDPDRKFMVELSLARLIAEESDVDEALDMLGDIGNRYKTQMNVAGGRLQEAFRQTRNAISNKRPAAAASQAS